VPSDEVKLRVVTYLWRACRAVRGLSYRSWLWLMILVAKGVSTGTVVFATVQGGGRLGFFKRWSGAGWGAGAARSCRKREVAAARRLGGQRRERA